MLRGARGQVEPPCPCPRPRGSGRVTRPQGSAAPHQGAAPLPPFLARHCRCLATASPPHAVRPGRGQPRHPHFPPFISTENSSPLGRGQRSAPRGPAGAPGEAAPAGPPGTVPSGQGGKAPPPHPRVSFMARAHSPRRRPRFPPFCTAAPFPAASAPPAWRPLAAAARCAPLTAALPPRHPFGLLTLRGGCSFPDVPDLPCPWSMLLPRGGYSFLVALTDPARLG